MTKKQDAHVYWPRSDVCLSVHSLASHGGVADNNLGARCVALESWRRCRHVCMRVRVFLGGAKLHY